MNYTTHPHPVRTFAGAAALHSCCRQSFIIHDDSEREQCLAPPEAVHAESHGEHCGLESMGMRSEDL